MSKIFGPGANRLSCQSPDCPGFFEHGLIVPEYKTRIRKMDIIIPNAVIDKCDTCGKIAVHGKELHRWDEIRNNTTTVVKITSKPPSYYDIYIGRENKYLKLAGSKWGNPYHLKNESHRSEVLEKYKIHIENSPELIAALPELRGNILGCYCFPKRCHGNILIELLEKYHGNKIAQETN